MHGKALKGWCEKATEKAQQIVKKRHKITFYLSTSSNMWRTF